MAETNSRQARRGRTDRALRTLFEISKATAVARDAGRIADITADHIRQLFRVDIVGLWLWDEARHALMRAASSRAKGLKLSPEARPVRGGLAWQVFSLSKRIVVDDYANYEHRMSVMSAGGVKVAVGVPFLMRGQAIGALSIGRVRPEPFDEGECQTLEYVAEELAPIAEGMQLRQQIDARRREAEALADLARQGVRERDLSTLLALLAQRTVELLGADYAIVNEVDEDANVTHRGGFGEQGIPAAGPLTRTGIGRAVLDAGRSLVLTQADEAGRFQLAQSQVHSKQGAWALLASPVPSFEGLRGVLHAGWRSQFQPGPEELRVIETLAAFGGGMIDIVHGRDLAERREFFVERRLALAAISDALDDASRDVEAMLQVTARETSRVMHATCAIRLLSEDGQIIHGGAVFGEDDPALVGVRRAMVQQEVSLADSLYQAVVLEGKPGRWFDPSGRKAKQDLPPFIRRALGKLPLYASLVAPIRLHGKVLGTIAVYRHHDAMPFEDRDGSFLMDIGERVGPVLENARLFEQLSASRARLEALSQRLVAVQDYERRAIALELHDEISQSLTAARLLIEAAKRLPARLRDDRLAEAGHTLDDAIGQVRGLTLDLRPPMLDGFGLAPALTHYFERYKGRTGVRVEFQPAELTIRPVADIEIAAYRIIQEGLTNVARHAGVDSTEVRLWDDARELHVRIADHGCGFDPARLQGGSTGLSGMQERAEALGGELVVESAPGRGTCLCARLPLKPAPSRLPALTQI